MVVCEQVTINLDTADVEVYGRKKRGVAYNYQGQRCGRPHVATWAETATALAADLMAGDEDPRGHAAELLRRALASLPASARAGRRINQRGNPVNEGGLEAEAAALAARDQADSSRVVAPLRASPDAVPLDTTTMAFPDQVRFIVELARPIFGARS